MKPGDYVVKNPATWEPNEFDRWGRGRWLGVVVEPPFSLDDDTVDVRWHHGRCFEKKAGLTLIPLNDEEKEKVRVALLGLPMHEVSKRITTAYLAVHGDSAQRTPERDKQEEAEK